MNAKSILDGLLTAGKELSSKAADFAEKKLGLPEDPKERQELLQKLGIGAAIGSIATVMLGTRAGRKMTGGLVKIGSVAALGGIAYTAYQNWRKSQGISTSDTADRPLSTLTGADADQRSQTILRAMIAAAQADGQVDSDEQSIIEKQFQKLDLPDDARQWLSTELSMRRNAAAVAAMADSPAAAAEIYMASMLMIDNPNTAEEAYLNELRQSLKLDAEFAAELERLTAAQV